MAHIEYTVNSQSLQIPILVDAVTYLDCDSQGFRPEAEPTPQTVASFYHSLKFNVVLSFPSQVLFVNQCKVTLFKIIREGDVLSIGSTEFTFHEIWKEVLSSESEPVRQKTRCTVCRKIFEPGAEVVSCPKCERLYHKHCWEYQKGRCPNRFCQYQSLWVEPIQQPADQKT
jgi:hypothetical protein